MWVVVNGKSESELLDKKVKVDLYKKSDIKVLKKYGIIGL